MHRNINYRRKRSEADIRQASNGAKSERASFRAEEEKREAVDQRVETKP
jgi:hypothetical protein